MNGKILGGVALGVVLLAGVAVLLHQQPAALPTATQPAVAPAAPEAARDNAAQPAPVVAPADCLLPGPPPVPPNGYMATAQDIKLGHDVMQAFVNALEAYQSCRNNQADYTPGATEQQKTAWIAQGNAAIDEANALAAAFGRQLKIYKTRPGAQ